jgi:hypothetical protein
MKHTLRRLAAIASMGMALLATEAAQAQSDTPEARRTLARELVKTMDELSGPERSMKAVGASIRQALQQQIAAESRLTPAQQQRAAEVLSQEASAAVADMLRSIMPTMYAAIEDLYVQRFSLAELQEVQRFYTSTPGRKSVVVIMEDLPQLMQPMMQRIQNEAPAMQGRLEAAAQRLREEGIELSKKP